MPKVTMREIAGSAGVSLGTVSKVLRGDPTVKEQNRLAVQTAIQALDYNVNQAARRLAHKPILLGVMLPSAFDEYFEPMKRGIAQVVESLADYRVSAVYRYYTKFDDDESIADCLNYFSERGVDGMLLGPMHYIGRNETVLSLLKSCRIPIVLLLSDIPDLKRLACVSMDATLSGRTAAELAALLLPPGSGCAVFVGNKDVTEHHLKASGFCARSVDFGIHSVRVLETQDDSQLAYMLACNLIRQNQNLQLIYAATGNSVAVCRAICDSGRQGTIRVIATDLPEGLQPYIESGVVIGVLDQHLEQIGASAVDRLYRYLTDGAVCGREIRIPASLLLYSAIERKLHPQNE